MDTGPPDQKRPRLTGPAPPGPAQWQTATTTSTTTETSRQLPPPTTASYQPHPPPLPFSRPPEPQHPLDHRPPPAHADQHQQHPPYDHPDLRRPSSGPPSHVYHHPPPPPPPPPPFPAQQATMVKRDPSDEPPPPPQQYRRSPPGTTGDPPPLHHDGYRTHLQPFEPHPAQHPYRTASYPPPHSPIAASDPYGHAHYGGGSGVHTPQTTYPSVSYPSTPNLQNPKKPKAQRAAQACDSCRTLKAKCDEGRPNCLSCREKGIECRYRDPPPKQYVLENEKRQDRVNTDIMEAIMRMEQTMRETVRETVRETMGETMGEAMRGIQGEISKRVKAALGLDLSEEAVPKQEAQDPTSSSVADYLGARTLPSASSESQAAVSTESPYSTPSQPRPQERPDTFPGRPGPPHTARVPAGEEGGCPAEGEGEEEEEVGGEPGPAKPSSIPVNHTTGAARLLIQPGISELWDGTNLHAKFKYARYPIIQEEKRGLLRLYGRGEGIDAPPGYDRDPLIDSSDSTSGDTSSEVSSPAGEEWGQLGGLTPPGNPPPEFTRGSINVEGMPDLSREVVLNLVQSYKDHINNMHPILIPKRLDVLVESFLKSTPESQAKPKQVSSLVAGHHANPPFVGFVRNPESPGNKRKRSPALGEYPEVQNYYDVKPGHPFRSISSALVLLVLALGEITQHRGKIPDGVSDRDADVSWTNSPTIRNGYPPSPLQSSPSLSTPVGVSPPQEADRPRPRSRRTSLEGAYTTKGGSPVRRKNIDAIPGLFYFALATDIIGNQLAGNSLQHVHVNILAGLYHGQLGRVMESHAYIHQACRGLQVILRPKMDRFKKIRIKSTILPAKDNPLVIAFWTCLQLESDIVAELPCPHSGILTYEDDMPSPNLKAASDIDGFHPIVMESYAAQLFMRKHLNQLHNMFYDPENSPQLPSSVYPATKEANQFSTLEACETHLNSFLRVAPNMAWSEDDDPATEILGARLRAKYYGAQVITYRPFILKILEHSARPNSFPAEGAGLAEFKKSVGAPRINSNATRVEDIDRKVLGYAKSCIKALINSTRAFHGIGEPGKDRLIVTNIWGTAHAQWGNLLTLQAAYKNPILGQWVDQTVLRDLLEKTIAMLKLVSSPSSALYTDMRILQYTGTVLDLLKEPKEQQEQNASSSFSSTATGDVAMGGH